MNASPKRALVLGAGGFIGSHLVKRLKREGYSVMGVDLKAPEFSESHADDFVIGDLRDRPLCASLFEDRIDEVYQLAADMGGAGFIFTGENDADIMHNSAMINLNILDEATKKQSPKIFYSSSACIYPAYNQEDPDHPDCAEHTAYPAAPDSEYGWEKLFSERLYLAYARAKGAQVHVARFHNIFGEEGTYEGGREKAPAAFCRKIAESEPGFTIPMWGDGKQTRSFLYIDDCVDAIRLMMTQGAQGPLNIGSEEQVTINELVQIISAIANKNVTIDHIEGPQGVRGRNSHNALIEKTLGFRPRYTLRQGLERTYPWIADQVKASTHTALEKIVS